MSDYITTYTGKHFEPMYPDPELICRGQYRSVGDPDISGRNTCHQMHAKTGIHAF